MSRTQTQITNIPYMGEKTENDFFVNYIERENGKIIRLYSKFEHNIPNPIRGEPEIVYSGQTIDIYRTHLFYHEHHYSEGYSLTLNIKSDLSKYLEKIENIKDYDNLMKNIVEVTKKVEKEVIEKGFNKIKEEEIKIARRGKERLYLLSDNIMININEGKMEAKIDNIEILIELRTSNFTNCNSRYCTILEDYFTEEEEKKDYSNYSVKDIIKDAKMAVVNFLEYIIFKFSIE